MKPTKKTASRPGPKPRGPFQNKRRTLTTRITDQTRQRLEEAAEYNDRLLSQEIELRLERSFQDEQNKYDEFGGSTLYWFLKAMAATGRLTAERMGGDLNDAVVQTEVMKSMRLFLRNFKIKPAARRPKRSARGKAAKPA